MHIQPIHSLDQLESLREPWDRLARGVPFCGHLWLSTWWKHYGIGHDLAVLTVYGDDGRVLGIAPWYLASDTLGGRVLLPLGSGEVCSDYLTILCRPEHELVVAEALAQYLCSPSAPAWDLLSLSGVDPEDSATSRFVDRMKAHGQAFHARAAHRTWRVALPSSWEAFVDLQSKSHRKQLRRLQTRVLADPETQLQCVQTEAEFAEAWDTLVNLHQRRRQSLAEPGSFVSPRFAAFHREVAGKLLAAGRLRLFVLHVAGQPIAAEYQIAGDRVTYAYQAGVDPDRLDEEPGRLITLATIQQAIEAGQNAFDFLRGDEPYKAHLRTRSHANPRLPHRGKATRFARAPRPVARRPHCEAPGPHRSRILCCAFSSLSAGTPQGSGQG